MSTVSVVIPVRDCELYLGEAIESILRARVQPLEVIVVDDGSTDATAALAGSFGEPVMCLGQPPRGVAAACNRGIAAASGDLLAFLDADDLWTSEKLASQLRILEDDASLEAVFGHAIEFATPELTDRQRSEVRIRAGAVPARVRGTMLARRSLLERIGPFNEEIQVGDFIDWHARADEAGVRTLLVDEVYLYRRVHVSNVGRGGEAAKLDYVRVAREALRRREAKRS